jgi:SpoVK/Ycf46/Vps4 family AAA+-type ATPase
VSYLLQRIENYNGLVILASNYKSNMDEAFVRRFQSIVYFPMPNGRERLQIWEKAFPKKANLHRNVGLPVLAQKYELSGAEIMNVVQHCCFGALANGTSTICQADLLRGIEREFQKEGKIMR